MTDKDSYLASMLSAERAKLEFERTYKLLNDEEKRIRKEVLQESVEKLGFIMNDKLENEKIPQ